MAKQSKKNAAPVKPSPKHAAADLRKLLYAELGPVEETARELLKGINKLRHGELEHISQLGAMQSACDDIAEDLGTLGQKLKDHT